MKIYPEIKVLILSGKHDSKLKPLISYFSGMRHLVLSVVPDLPKDLSAFDVIVTSKTSDITLKTGTSTRLCPN